MKKTFTVNLNNTVFHIDDDAYETLKKYLSEIAQHFTGEDKDDIMNDIESRIAELFSERLQDNKQVITLIDVNEIIRIMGKPSQFAGDEESTEPKNKSSKRQRKTRRFYRDPENAILGGIAGGIAAYFNWDVVLIRIALILLVFLGFGIIIPVYIIAWIITPAATTAAQRLEMQGEDVTIDNIKNEFDNMKNYVQSEKFKNSAKSVGSRLSEIFLMVFKIFFGFIGVILGFVGFVVLGALITALVLLIVQPAFFHSFNLGDFWHWIPVTTSGSILFLISTILVIGCPLFILIYGAIRILSKRSRKSSGVFWIVLVVWIISLIIFSGFRVKTFIKYNSEKNNYHSWTWDNSDSLSSEMRTVEGFHSIKISDNISLYLTQDSVQQVKVVTHDNLFSKIKTEVKDGVLSISTQGVIVNHSPKIHVNIPDLERIDTRGAVSVETGNTLKLKNLALISSGASNIDMNIIIDSLLSMEINGAADVNLSGNSKYLEIETNGASEVDTEDLKAEHVKIRTRGASSVEVYASESIDIDTKGLGDIRYSGNPKTVKR